MHNPLEHSDVPSIFRWDAGIVRDGCFFAGYLAASVDGEVLEIPGEDKHDETDPHLSVDEGVSICLGALETMRWGYSKSEEREETVRMIWQNRKLRRQGSGEHSPVYDLDYPQTTSLATSHMPLNVPLAQHGHLGMSMSHGTDRPMLPPLAAIPQRRVESAPNTAASTDGRGLNGWPSYTPPGTSTSIATSTGTGLSGSGSPVFSVLPTFKTSAEEIFYHSSNNDIDQFTYNVPLSGSVRETSGLPSNISPYPHRASPLDSRALSASAATTYLPTSSFHSSNTSILTDFQPCPQFSENSSGPYH